MCSPISLSKEIISHYRLSYDYFSWRGDILGSTVNNSKVDFILSHYSSSHGNIIYPLCRFNLDELCIYLCKLNKPFCIIIICTECWLISQYFSWTVSTQPITYGYMRYIITRIQSSCRWRLYYNSKNSFCLAHVDFQILSIVGHIRSPSFSRI